VKSYKEFFAELKRRKVFKVAAVYGAGAFIILQAADILGQGLRLPESFLPFITAVVLLGFPLALLLAWAFEVTPDGVQRTSGPAAGEIEGIVAAPASQRWPAGLMALAGVVALVAGAWWVGRQSASETAAGAAQQPADDVRLAFVDPSEDPRPSIAVLPFADMSRGGDQEYFSDGITEEILNTLAKIRELRVSARTSAFAYKNVQRDLREVGQELGVAYLLEGSVRKDGDQLRITTQLIEVASDAHLWSDTYDRTLDNVFQIQSEIAEAIALELRVPLGLEAGESLVTPTADLEAFDLYLAGRARMRERGPSVLEAVDLFAAAVARDSAWAPGWAGLAESHALVPYYLNLDGFRRNADSLFWNQELGAAEAAALTALELDPNNASATIALANVHRDRWHWEAAEQAYLRASQLDPDNVEVHQQYAELLHYVGRLDEALAASRRALALDRSPVRLNVAGFIARDNRLYDEGIRLLEETVAQDPDRQFVYARPNLLLAYIASGEWERAWELMIPSVLGSEEAVAAARADWPEPGPLMAGTDFDAWRVGPRLRATLWQVAGESEKAIGALEEALLGEPLFGTTGAIWYPIFEPLLEDPRIRAHLAARGLADRRPIRAAPDSASAP
jgi:TolB-like protein